MAIRRFTVPVTVDADGDAEVYSSRLSGKLCQIRYVKDDYADGVDFVITSEETGETLWAEDDVNASASRSPRAATHTTAGAAALYAGTGAVNSKIGLDTDRVKIVIADGGVSTTGTFIIIVDG